MDIPLLEFKTHSLGEIPRSGATRHRCDHLGDVCKAHLPGGLCLTRAAGHGPMFLMLAQAPSFQELLPGWPPRSRCDTFFGREGQQGSFPMSGSP